MKSISNLTKQVDIYQSTLFVLYAKMHNLHWNIVGKEFLPIHKKLEEIYEFIHETLDDVAEYMLALKHNPVANLSTALKHSLVKEIDSKNIDTSKALDIALKDLDILLNQCNKVKEECTKADVYSLEDLMIRNNIAINKFIWMLRASNI